MTRSAVVFVATEFEPLIPGGAGTLISGVATRLADHGRKVVVLLIGASSGTSVHAGVSVVGVVADGGFFERSRAAAAALQEMNAHRPIERVEFQDFEGLAFAALSQRSELGLSNLPISVRFHGPTHLLLEGAGIEASVELALAGVMEEESVRMSDFVMVPSTPIGSLVVDRYGVERRRIVIAPPIVPEVTRIEYRPKLQPEIVCYGRLAEAKGSGELLAASIPLLRERTDLRLRYLGRDGWNITENRSMREWLSEAVPPDLRHCVVFEPSPGLGGLAPALSGAWIAVVPSHFESFCLAAHEVRNVGLPTVLPDLPAFRPFFDEATGGVRYDGTVPDLTATLRELLADSARLARLAEAPAPVVGDPLRAYEDPPPPTRPAAAQSALATAASNRLEAMSSIEDAQRGRVGRVATAALRFLPNSLAHVAVHLVPQSMKDRFRSIADWRAEAERREEIQRRALVSRRIEAGEFPDLSEPDTTVVIPCFNQGEYLDEAIMSVFEQTDASFEIVVVDDGSTDPMTLEVLETLDWPRTRVIRQENQGLPSARNRGMATALGRFVVPLDADDALEPRYLADLKAALNAKPNAAYAHCNGRYFGDMDAYWITRPFNSYQLLLSNSVLGCVLMRREAWEAVGGYDESMIEGNEDWDLWLRLMEAGWEQIKVQQSLFRYRRVGTSMSIGALARLEDAQVELAHQLPDLYASAPDLKRDWYPWVSVITAHDADLAALDRQDMSDIEVVPMGSPSDELVAICERHSWPLRPETRSIEEAIRVGRGKFVVEWDTIVNASAGLLRTLAGTLDTNPDAATAGPEADTVVMWRRWVLHDADAPATRQVVVGDCDARSGRIRRGTAPIDGWMLPRDLPEPHLEVIRQPPEETGDLPEWLSDAVRSP